MPPKPPAKLPPLAAPRPTGPANRVLLEQQAIIKAQSDHEIKVDEEVSAIMTYTRQREAFDNDLARGLGLVARQLGVEKRLPQSIQSLVPPPIVPPEAGKPRGVVARIVERARHSRDPATPVHENARQSASSADVVLVLVVLKLGFEFGIELLSRIPHGLFHL